jgi:spermidine/putrescine transport system ATP-binding protein
MTTPRSSTAPADVELRAVVKRFGDVAAVDHIDLVVPPGEFLALLGPSGCGKTTTLRIIAGFEQPTAGEVLVAGQSMLGVPPHRREVNTVFQHYALFPHMRVLDNVAYGLKQRGVAKAERERQAADALAMVRMDGFERRRPAEMSGGQQQRVALARALVMRPRVLLLDEPLGALDLKLRREMQVELKGIQDEVGITFVIVTHDQEEAMALADRIAVMHRGRIEQLASPTAVYDAPASAFVAGFVGELNVLHGTLLEAGEQPVVDVGAGLQVRAGRVVEPGRAGQGARVGLRPEHVTARSGHTPEGVEATVATVMVVGHELQVVARLAGGGQLMARQPRDVDPLLEAVAPGERVRLTWPPTAAMLLGPSEATAPESSPGVPARAGATNVPD